MDTLYKARIIDHYKSPRNYGELDDLDHKSLQKNLSCGDEIEVFLKVKDDLISDIKFTGRGCAISIAAMSLLSEKLKGLSLSEARDISENDILESVGIKHGSARSKCALLGFKAVSEALNS